MAKREGAAMVVVFETKLERQWMRKMMLARLQEINESLVSIGRIEGASQLAQLGVNLYQAERDFLERQLEELDQAERRITRC